MNNRTNGMVGGVVEQAGNTESARIRSPRVPVFAIDRLRMGTDGYGVTTLVAFMGCPLKCKYCLNPQCHEPIYEGEGLRKGIMLLTPQELYELVKIDNIYFQATGGGICFGGGEPTMYVGFLESFRQICGRKWKLTLETCLSCSYRTIARLCHIVDYWIVDVKSMNPDIYRRYTGCRSAVEQHLAALKKLVSPDSVTVKVPSIEGFTVGCDLDADVDRIKQDFGFKDVVRIQYVNPSKLTDKKRKTMSTGKEKCERLRAIRKEVARQYGLDYVPVECTHTGDCSGTCPKCDEELRNLQSQLDKKGVKDVDLHVEISSLADNPGEMDVLQGEDMAGRLEGMPSLPYAMPKEHDRILYKQCRIAGTAFHNLEDIWDELHEGAKLALVRQKDNKHDKRAIAVALASDYDGDPDEFDFSFILGYVPRSENEQLAAMMDMGWGEVFECELSRIEGHDPRRGSLFMDIYIVKNKAVADAGRLFWVCELGDEGYGQFVDNLFGQGFAYFRWGGYPVWERVLPKRKSKVVVVNRGREDARLHLMYVMATTIDRAGFFVEDPDELDCVDDCSPFILTQVSGPLVVQLPELGFLDAFDTRKDNPFGPLPESVAEKLLSLFRNVQEG